MARACRGCRWNWQAGPASQRSRWKSRSPILSILKNKMRYKTYRQQGLFYSSGVIEGGGKSVIGQRLKESGMFWTEAEATSVLNLRLALKSNRWDECWDRLHNSRYLKIKVAAQN